jgi:hypothetical protein
MEPPTPSYSDLAFSTGQILLLNAPDCPDITKRSLEQFSPSIPVEWVSPPLMGCYSASRARCPMINRARLAHQVCDWDPFCAIHVSNSLLSSVPHISAHTTTDHAVSCNPLPILGQGETWTRCRLRCGREMWRGSSPREWTIVRRPALHRAAVRTRTKTHWRLLVLCRPRRTADELLRSLNSGCPFSLQVQLSLVQSGSWSLDVAAIPGVKHTATSPCPTSA